MAQTLTSKEDELVMKLLHYFITEGNYTPIVLHGANNEIWLENFDSEYKIVRIVSNYIHNNEQFETDLFKTKQIMHSISKKTLSPSLNTLSLFINLGDNVEFNKIDIDDNIMCANIKKISDLKKYEFITEIFPDIINKTRFEEKGMELFAKITGEITAKSEVNAKKAEDIFKPKRPYITYGILIINCIIFVLTFLYNVKNGNALIDSLFGNSHAALHTFGGLKASLVRNGEYFRLITAAFNHNGLFHLLFNSYALYVIGSQLESYIGKLKYIIVYLVSAISGSLLAMALSDAWGAGASGAIFGLLGAILYFGYHYRVYLGTVIRSQIIPLILINLTIGFLSPEISNSAHIGGLIGGFLTLQALGVKYKSTKVDQINGIVLLTVYVGFLIYISFFR